jgi:hypothetical protein
LAAAFLILNFIIPPFQNPDEPYHFAAALIFARGGEIARADVESSVLRMMDEANWWRLVGIGRPNKLPARLSDISSQMDGTTTEDFRERLQYFELWHRLVGWAMRPFAGSSLEILYYLCRAMSSLFLLGVFLFLWKTFEILAASFGRTICWGFALVLVLPQFLSVATAATPDAFVILICAAFFYGAAALIAGGSGMGNWARVGQAVLVVFLPVIAFFTDRAAFVIAPLALLSAFLIIRKKNARLAVFGILIGAIAAILVARFVATRYPLTVGQIINNVTYIFKGSGKAFLLGFGFSKYFWKFWAFMADGFLLKFGWLVFGAPAWIYWIWRILLGAAIFGLILRPVKWIKARMNPVKAANGNELPEGAARFQPRWLVLTIASIGIQALGVWVALGANGQFGEGRYFFPVVTPIAFLLALGLFEFGEFLKKGAGQKILAGTVLAEVLLLTFAIWTRMAPAFHLTLRGPHPGV